MPRSRIRSWALTGIATLAMAAFAAASASAAVVPTITINGVPLDKNYPATVQGGHVLVPFRSTLEAWGAEVEWEPSTQTATASKNDAEVAVVTVGKPSAKINGAEQALSPTPIMANDQVYAPIELIAAITGATIVTAPDGKSIQLTGGEINSAPSWNPAIAGVYMFAAAILIGIGVVWAVYSVRPKKYLVNED